MVPPRSRWLLGKPSDQREASAARTTNTFPPNMKALIIGIKPEKSVVVKGGFFLSVAAFNNV